MNELLRELLETLELLLAQTRAYQRSLPADNYPARAAVDTLAEIARQAEKQAQDLEEALENDQAEAEHPLSRRELEVLQLASQGLTNKQIAYRLHLSERTIQHHLRSVFNKTGTENRTEAVAQAIRQGWW